MTTISNIAQRVLDENNYTTSDISKTKLEYLIDNSIHYINLQAGTTIADLDGSAESKSLTATDSEIFVVKSLSSLILRAYKDKGPQVSIGGLNVASITTDPHYRLFMKLINKAITSLRSPPVYISNDPVPT